MTNIRGRARTAASQLPKLSSRFCAASPIEQYYGDFFSRGAELGSGPPCDCAAMGEHGNAAEDSIARRNRFDLSGLGSSFVNSLAIPGVFVRKGNDSERAAQNQK